MWTLSKSLNTDIKEIEIYNERTVVNNENVSILW